MFFRSHSSYLLPRYQQRSNEKTVVYYDGVDARDPGSEEAATNFMAKLQAWKEQPDVSSDNEESSEDDAPDMLTRLQTLSSQYPVYALYLKAIAYQAGIYEPKKFVAHDPQLSQFFRVLDNVDETKLPADVAAFCQDCNRMNNALPFSKR